MNTQRIESGTPDGDALGFFESLYSGWLEIRENDRLYLHFIISRNKNKGNTQALLRQWLAQGYDVRVVMPRPVMQHILKKLQFVPSMETLPEMGPKGSLSAGTGEKHGCSPAPPELEAGKLLTGTVHQEVWINNRSLYRAVIFSFYVPAGSRVPPPDTCI